MNIFFLKRVFRVNLFFLILDKIINELEKRFKSNSNILYAIDNLHSKVQHF